MLRRSYLASVCGVCNVFFFIDFELGIAQSDRLLPPDHFLNAIQSGLYQQARGLLKRDSILVILILDHEQSRRSSEDLDVHQSWRHKRVICLGRFPSLVCALSRLDVGSVTENWIAVCHVEWKIAFRVVERCTSARPQTS